MTHDQIHIVLCAYQIPNQSDGGLESTTRIFEALSEDFRWTFITNLDTRFTKRWQAGGAHVNILHLDPTGTRIARALQYARWSVRIFGCARINHTACIHANDHRAFKASMLPARVSGVPLVRTIRGTKPKDEDYGGQWRRVGRQSSRVIALSKEMARLVNERIGVPEGRLRVINSIVDLDRFAPLDASERSERRMRMGLSDNEFAVGCVGAFRELKNQIDIIEKVIPELVKRVPRARLHFFGDFDPERCNYAARCKVAIAHLSLEKHASFHGHTPNIADWMQVLDCIVIGSQREGLARSMIEAMACGIPVVSFAVCSAEEMLEDTGAGCVVSLGDHAALTDRLVRFANNPEAGCRMGKRGRSVAEQRFDVELIRSKYRELYKEVCREYVDSRQ